jgi:hypothetical protein
MNSTVGKAAMHRDSEVKVLAHDPGKKSCAPLKAMKRSHQAANPAGEYSHPHQIDAGLCRGYGSVLWRAPPGRAIHKVLHASEQEREDVVRARRRWIRDQGLLDSTHLVLKPLMPLQERSTETITSTGISTGQALLGKTDAPVAHRPRHGVKLARDRARRSSASIFLRTQEQNARPQHVPLLRRGRAQLGFQHRTLLRAQPDLSRSSEHRRAES